LTPAPPAPESLCLLRLSALGDVTHVLPVLRALQRHWPSTRISWVLGKAEAKLLDGLDGVELVPFDKAAGLAGYRDLRTRMRGRRFDVLLHMQLALRANLAALQIRARRVIGYPRSLSKEGHGLVLTERIPEVRGHVLDVFGSFLQPLGLDFDRVEWRMPVPEAAREWARTQWPQDGRRTLLVSPCSSHALRNWRAERYAAVMEHAAARDWRVVLCGGRSALERRMGDAILSACKAPVLDLVGKDTLKQLIALLERADLVLTPDSGPAHIANAVGTRVLGLYACTDAERSGPYSDRRYTVNHHALAAERFLRKPAAALRWGGKIEREGVMDLIQVAEVIERFEAYAAEPGPLR
jgi:heptosyltransferase I